MGIPFARRSVLIGLVSAAATIAASSLVTSASSAAVRGRFRLNRRDVDEADGMWRMIAVIYLAAPAPSASVTLHFDWRQHAEFEGTGDQQRRRALDPPRLVTEDQAVDFSDPKGRIGKEARAELVPSRTRKFTAGQWSLEVRGPDGPIGTRVQVTLRGNNPSG